MEPRICTMCLNLNSCALDQQPLKDSKIHNFAIRANAEKCLYCKIVWDGLEAIGFGKEPMILSVELGIDIAMQNRYINDCVSLYRLELV
jgi:hypothetical protein